VVVTVQLASSRNEQLCDESSRTKERTESDEQIFCKLTASIFVSMPCSSCRVVQSCKKMLLLQDVCSSRIFLLFVYFFQKQTAMHSKKRRLRSILEKHARSSCRDYGLYINSHYQEEPSIGKQYFSSSGDM